MTIKDYDQLLTNYELLRPLGRGGMGEVFLAKDLLLDRDVAVKFLKVNSGADNEIIQKRFQNEAKILASLDHPNIVRIFNFGVANDVNFIVMEYVEGEALSEVIARGPIKVEQAVKVLRRLVRGIRQAHESAIIHRDIKPANIILTAKKDIKIVDFGISKNFVSEEENFTKENHFIGTINYMAPELLLGQSPTMMSDIFSVGVIFYEMVTGKNPFTGANQFETIENIKTVNLRLPQEIRNQLPQEFIDIFSSMVSRQVQKRCQSSTTLYTQLKALKASEKAGKQVGSTEQIPVVGNEETSKTELFTIDSFSELVVASEEKTEFMMPDRNTGTSLKNAIKEFNTEDTGEVRKFHYQSNSIGFLKIALVLSALAITIKYSPKIKSSYYKLAGTNQVAKRVETEEPSKERNPAKQEAALATDNSPKILPVLDFPDIGGQYHYHTQVINDGTGKVVKEFKYIQKVNRIFNGFLQSKIRYSNGVVGTMKSSPNNFIPPLEVTNDRGTLVRHKVSGNYNSIYPLEVGGKMNFTEFILGKTSSFVAHNYECKVVKAAKRVVKVTSLDVFLVECEQVQGNSPKLIITEYSPKLRQTIRKEVRYMVGRRQYVESTKLIDFQSK